VDVVFLIVSVGVGVGGEIVLDRIKVSVKVKGGRG